MTGLSTRSDGQQVGRAGGRDPSRRRAGAALLAAAGLSIGATLATAPSAAAVTQCPAGAVLFGNACIILGFPTPTTTPATTPPTTAPPLVSLPPVTLPPVPVTVPPALTAGPAATVPDAGQRLLDLANTERQRAGLGQLTSRDDIVAIALAHSQEMARAGDIFHSTRFFTSSVKNLLNASVRGENVAYNGDIDDAHARLMASAGHRANLMDPRFSAVGFAVVRAADGRFFITQNFIQPAGAPRAAQAPRVAAAPRPAAPAASRKAAAPKPAPAPPTTVAPPPSTTVAPPAPVPAVPAAAARPVVALDDTSSAVSASVAPRSSDQITGPLTATAVALLAGALCASCVVPRRRAG